MKDSWRRQLLRRKRPMLKIRGVTKGKKSESLVSVLHTYLVFRLGRSFDLSETKK